jgi:hypothetical protein
MGFFSISYVPDQIGIANKGMDANLLSGSFAVLWILPYTVIAALET